MQSYNRTIDTAKKPTGSEHLYLKTLEIHGFKSFARPVRLEFTPVITALVGPNGSGKSNVVDAVRWCLGEQSLRDIRGQSAQDVIYAGPRRSLGMAEVRMTFERRRDDHLDVPGDLSVARRLYRSGESEYVLDGQKVRLRDVSDALRAIGIDEAEHVVVNQGMADALLSATAMDRRSLLEQAAGLAGYRTRRDEARSKLAITRRNVDTVETVLAEMEPRLRMLRRQARAVAERDDAKRRLRSRLELWLSHRWTTLNNELAQLDEQRSGIEEDRRSTSSEVAELEEQAESILEVERAWQQEMDVVTASVYLAQKDRDSAAHALSAAEQRIQDLRGRVQERAARLAEVHEGDGLADERRDRLLQEIAGFRQRADELAAERRAAEEQTKETSQRLEELSGRAEAESKDLAEKKKARELALESASSQRRQVTDYQERIGRLQSWLSQAQDEADALTVELEGLDQQVSLSRQDLKALSADRDEADAAASAAGTRLAKLDRVRERINARISERSRQEQSASRALEALEPQLASSPIRTLEVRRGWEEAISATISDWTGEPASCDLREFMTWRSGLERSLSTSILWAETQVSVVEGITPLHASALVESDDEVETLWAVLVGKSAHTIGTPPVSVVSRSGKKMSAVGQELSAAAQDIGARYLQLRRQKEDAASWLSIAQRRSELLDSAREPAEEQLEESRLRVEALSASVAELNESLARTTARADRLCLEKEAISDGLPKRVSELERLRADEREQLVALRASEQELARMESGLQSLIQTSQRTEQDLLTAREELDSEERELRRLAQEAEAVETRRATHEHLLEALHRGRERAATEIQGLEAEIRSLRQQEELTGGELTTLREGHVSADELVREATSRRESVEQRRPAHSVRSVELQEARRRLSEVIPRHERVLARMEHLQSGREALLAEITEELSVSPDRLPEVEDDIPTAEEVQRLRGRASQYADADESVIDESKELEERFAYLQRHAEDLRSAADNLQEIMELADNEMRGRFADAFAAVNAEFGRVFEVMLRGGHAELIENPDGGVDIVAQLPGKKTRSSAAFSGGERSLVASSLLFGVLKIRPTPFCVLDEVDAALDESNVDRYLAALRDISERTQVIVVTHNRATMAATDTLYGMTMDDEGVSSLLSLRLDAYEAV